VSAGLEKKRDQTGAYLQPAARREERSQGGRVGKGHRGGLRLQETAAAPPEKREEGCTRRAGISGDKAGPKSLGDHDEGPHLHGQTGGRDRKKKSDLVRTT